MSNSIAGRLLLIGFCIAFPLAVSSGDESGCRIQLSKERFMEFFLQMRSQPVFREGKNVGVRVFEKSKTGTGVLPELGLRSGDLVTHFCGVQIHDALSAEATICCKTEPVHDKVELMVERDGKMVQVFVPRPNKRAQDALKTTRT